MTTCYSKLFGVYHNDVPLPGDKIIKDQKVPGSTYDEPTDTWTLPPVDAARVQVLATINIICAGLLGQVKAGYPDDEVQSWSKQESEARAYAADNTAATPLLTAMSAAREVTLADLAARVIEKADLFAVVSGQIIGRRQLREDQINEAAANDAAAVLAIVW